jgi:hypothetical protein
MATSSLRPRTIQIYLPSGDPRGIRVAALTTSIVQAIEVPRALLAEFQQMPEAKQVGVYFLIGDNNAESEIASVYIGQTGSLGKRLNDHHIDPAKDFWNRALVMVSLINTFTSTHAAYLEWRGIQQANSAKRYLVQNGNAGSKPHTPRPLEADCEEVFDILRTLVATLGQPLFEPLVAVSESAPKEVVYFCKGANYDASAQYTEEGMVVLKGSRARVEVVPSMINTSPAKRREALLQDGVLVPVAGFLVFQQDVLFKSPSGASDAVTGASTNGWQLWKTKTGKTLDELERQSIAGNGGTGPAP